MRNAKLTPDDVHLIRELLAERKRLLSGAKELSNQKIAEKFGVTVHAINSLAYKGNWSSVK